MLNFSVLLIQPVVRARVTLPRQGPPPLLRNFATVAPSILNQVLSSQVSTERDIEKDIPAALDRKLLRSTPKTSLQQLIQQYTAKSGTILSVSLPDESRPANTRRPNIFNAADSTRNVITVAHCAQVGNAHKVTLSSGFALNVNLTSEANTKETLIVTCAHTLEEVREHSVPIMGID